MDEWPFVSLESVAAKEKSAISKAYGSAILAEDYREAGLPVVRGVNLARGRFFDDGFVFIGDDVAARMPGARLQAGDLVIAHRGSIGQVSMIPRHPRFDSYIASTSVVKVRVDESKMSPEFIYYWFASESGRRSLLEHVSAVGVPGIAQPVKTAKALRVPCPDLPTQQRIAGFLGALDDKIAANNRVLVLSDELVRARFALLGTDLRLLGDVADHVRAQVAPDSVAGESLYLGLEHLPRRCMWVQDGGRASDVTSAKAHFRAGDVLFGKLRPYFHKVVRAPADGIASTDILVLRAKDEALAGYVLACAASDAAVARATAASEGTRMPRTNWSQLSAVPMRWPGEEAARDFSRMVVEMANHSAQLARENRVLASARDELLPLLMSGKIQVREFSDRLTEEVSR